MPEVIMETETVSQNFTTFLEEQLNPSQYKAVTKDKGALLVVAGAGSGKTRVITARIANLILNTQANPRSIVALTFTNKAAGEMKERVSSFVGTEHVLPFVGTFHSYCLSLLRNNASLLPFPSFTIMDADDQKSLLKKIVKQNNLEKFATPSQLTFQISSLKNSMHQETSSVDAHPILKEIYHAYEAEKVASRCFDFDDLILEVLKLFKQNKEFKKNYQERIKHVLVDEYQDTSDVQHQLLKEMCLTPERKLNMDSVCAVGDEDQSIYSWRGATVANMLKFQHDFKPVTTIKIEQNYRSVKPILDAANSLIENNKLRNPKKLWSDRKASNRILLLSCRSGEQEAETIAHYLAHLPADKKRSDIAILYRTHFQSRVVEEALIYHSIAYKIVGGIRFYERKEIKDVLAYLRLMVNSFDKISLLRVINCPARGLGQKFEMLMLNVWTQNPFLNFRELLHQLCDNEEYAMPAKKKMNIKIFLSIFDSISGQESPSTLVKHILEKTDYLNYIRTSYDSKEAETKIDNVQELAQSITLYEQKHLEQNPDSSPSLDTFLHEVSLLQEKTTDADDQNEQVQMMTLHAAKGLEFDTVIITGLEEGLLPSSRSLNLPEDLEEERRLFYVGITRAKERLILLHASYRNTYGQIVDQAQSRFASEITENLMKPVNIEDMHSSQRQQILANWLGHKIVPSQLKTAQSFTAPQKHYSKPFTPPKKSRPSGYSGSAGKAPSRGAPGRSTNRSNGRVPLHKAAQSQSNRRAWGVQSQESSTAISNGLWKKNDRVRHKTFGIGIVTTVEKAHDKEFYITAIFKTGKKKILSSFLQKEL